MRNRILLAAFLCACLVPITSAWGEDPLNYATCSASFWSDKARR